MEERVAVPEIVGRTIVEAFVDPDRADLYLVLDDGTRVDVQGSKMDDWGSEVTITSPAISADG